MLEMSKYLLRIVIVGALIGIFVTTILLFLTSQIDFSTLDTASSNILSFFTMAFTYLVFIFKVVMIPKSCLVLLITTYGVIFGANIALLTWAFTKSVIFYVTGNG